MRPSAAFFRLLILYLITVPQYAAAAAAPAAGTTPPWRVAAREAWVRDAPATAPASTPAVATAAAQPAAGVLLHDCQIRIGADGDDRYEHWIVRLAAAQTGAHASQLRVSVAPGFQELVIHLLRLSHAGAAAQSFTAAQLQDLLRTQPAEADPRKRALNPQLQISLQLPQAQAGDLLEYEYTVHSRASRWAAMLPGHYATQWASGGDRPVRQERLHVSWPVQRPLRFRLNGEAASHAPRIQTQPGELDIQWRNLPPVASEPDTPRGFTSQGLVQLSDFSDWTQVAALLAPRYGGPESGLDSRADGVPDPRASARPATAQSGTAAAAATILDTLRLVQSRVRATPVGGGEPYAPADPAVVLRRGYGHSRDLARLLAALLHQAQNDALVALADGRHAALLDTQLPSPWLLDTGLVVARVGSREYWLNPAAPGPAAALATTDPAAVRQALIITPTGGALVALPQPAADSRLRSVTQNFDLREAGSQAATLTVTTQFRGSWAQAMRASVLRQSPAQRQLTQIQDVVQDYPTATAAGEVQLQDLAGGESVQLTARFQIPRAFGDARDPHFNFFAEAIAAAVQPRDESTRRLPLGLPWPLKLEQHIEAALPPQWQVPAGKVVIENPAFRYQREVRFTPGMLHIDHSYVVLSDHVDPADYPGYLQANAQVYQALGLQVRPAGFFWRRVADWMDSHWLAILAAAILVSIPVTIGWRRLRRE